MKKSLFLLLLLPILAFGQYPVFTKADSLRGSLSTVRTCYDVLYYDLEIKVIYEQKRIEGSNTIRFRAKESFNTMQVDLVQSMNISRITFRGETVNYKRIEGAVMITLPVFLVANSTDEIAIFYDGQPQEAANPPWDGGWVWKRDPKGKIWIATACESLGASAWWPCKDHLSDEPDSMKISIIIPKGLMAVSNGDLRRSLALPGNLVRYDWHVTYPINNYNVTVNIANYATINETYTNNSGTHKLDYYVLAQNVEKAKTHFQQVKKMMGCFEHFFGEYPFWRDGYALVETPFWGMEHQSAIAYGNEYKNNPFGFDFIIIHESGHEWFGNSLSMADRSDMWVHEAFTTYSEALYVEYTRNLTKAVAYLRTQRPLIKNSEPIIGPFGVSYEGWKDSDMYFKGTWMLHTLRNVVENDKLWFETIKQFAETYRLKSLTSEEVIRFFNQKLGKDYTWLFNEYLRQAEFPTLEYKIGRQSNKTQVEYRWVAKENSFILPVELKYGSNKDKWEPTTTWQTKTYNTINFNPQFMRDKGLYELKEIF